MPQKLYVPNKQSTAMKAEMIKMQEIFCSSCHCIANSPVPFLHNNSSSALGFLPPYFLLCSFLNSSKCAMCGIRLRAMTLPTAAFSLNIMKPLHCILNPRAPLSTLPPQQQLCPCLSAPLFSALLLLEFFEVRHVLHPVESHDTAHSSLQPPLGLELLELLVVQAQVPLE